jgi:outer membrane receptor for monomeric catechols
MTHPATPISPSGHLCLLAACATFLVAVSARAQTATGAPAAAQDPALQMSAFEVRTTQGQGYTAGNAASALKSDSAIMDIPANILVVSSDMIKDTGLTNSTDVLQYAGIGTFARGVAIQSRGSRIGNAYVDDVPLSMPAGIADDINIDAYEVVKGPM